MLKASMVLAPRLRALHLPFLHTHFRPNSTKSTSNSSSSTSTSPLSPFTASPCVSRIRNICIIAHIDHGKSSLSSRILRPLPSDNTSTAPTDREDIGLLDTLSVEMERGITVKATTASVLYTSPKTSLTYLINLFDSPGHVDFSHEVDRCLDVVEGGIILFDSSQGVQAQTMSVYEKARRRGVKMLPVLTKIDMENAKPLEVCLTVSEIFPEFDPDSIILTSARNNIGVGELLEEIVESVPPPVQKREDGKLRCRVVDSWYEVQRGVVCLLKLESGQLKEGDRVVVLKGENETNEGGQRDNFSVQEVGVMAPNRFRTKVLDENMMGYAIIGMRNPRQASPGGVIVLQKDEKELEKEIDLGGDGGKEGGSVLYASVHPKEEGSFDDLVNAVERLALNDLGLEVQLQKGGGGGGGEGTGGGPFLGPGLRIGFQGMLHVEIFRQRLMDEFGVEALVTSPKVKYEIKYLPSAKKPRAEGKPEIELIEDISNWPGGEDKFEVREPMVNCRVMAPHEYAGAIMDLITKRRGGSMETKVIDDNVWMFTARLPWAEVVTDFHDELKSSTAGFASYDAQMDDENPMEKANLCKVEILLNGEVVDVLSFIAHADVAASQGRSVCKKLEDVLPRQQFKIAIQAKAQNRIVARATVQPYRKDVLVKSGKMVGGGDITRKKKLLEKQKQGKKKMAGGKVTLSQEAFNSVITK
ncbi:hypothetical protein TrLO_g2644 [Triparma laevis f. longispina]|uniref:Translation factor GUF1 homolog, mitochondrial n=1 Tax=Triparma laevis f. longispina TaxID=1714387 RepID=A0A9W7KUH1_9STRA|nr:hypothetical protein TrLO_g2644 [Triparma laevis f. longispina]